MLNDSLAPSAMRRLALESRHSDIAPATFAAIHAGHIGVSDARAVVHAAEVPTPAADNRAMRDAALSGRYF